MFWVAKRFIAFCSLVVVSTILFSQVANALISNIPVELIIPNTTVTTYGKASPNALVTIKNDGVLVASVLSDSSGNFTNTFTTTSGLHQITTQFEDITTKKSAINTQYISVQPQKNTPISLFLAPTISRGSPSPINTDSVILIRGYTYSNSNVVLTINYGQKTETTTSNSSGFYEFFIKADSVGLGSHIATVTSYNGSNQSDSSSMVKFEIIDVNNNQGPATPDIIVFPSQLPPPVVLIPDDGSTIDGDTVIITGDSLPNAQINIYDGDILIGSVVADSSGKWSFKYVATKSPVTLTFEACIEDKCSVLSRTLTLNFNKLSNCNTEFILKKYRFWNIQVGENIELNILKSSGDGVVEIDWGDGSVETFSHDSRRSKPVEKFYGEAGQYNGKITFSGNNCSIEKFISVHVIDNEKNSDLRNVLWLLFILLIIVLVKLLTNKYQKKATQNSNNRV